MATAKSSKTSAKATGFSAKPQPAAAEAKQKKATNTKAAAAKTTKTPAAKTEATATPQPDKATQDLTAKITALQTELKTADSKEAKLQATIARLEEKLASQSDTLQDLQAQLKQSEKLQATLDKAEAAARNLAKLNETLMAENTALKEAAIPAEIVEEPTVEPEPVAPAPEKTSVLAKPHTPHSNLIHPVFPNDAPIGGGLEEQEVGWFD